MEAKTLHSFGRLCRHDSKRCSCHNCIVLAEVRQLPRCNGKYDCTCRRPIKVASSHIEIPECKAFEICQTQGKRCEACIVLPIEAWKRNTRAIIEGGTGDGS